MYLCYIDESGDTGLSGSPYLVLGAAALFEGKWAHLDKDITSLIGDYFAAGTRPSEIHLVDLKHGRNEFRRVPKKKRQEMIERYCAIITSHLPTELRLFTTIAEKDWWFKNNAGKGGDDLYLELFEDICSRIDLFLRRRYAEGYPSKGLVIADPHKPALSKLLKSQHKGFQWTGTRWTQLYNLIETVFFLDSHESPGLQVADFCSYAVWRLINSNDDSIIRMIKDMFDREPLASTINPGKWHGVKFLGHSGKERINSVWP